MTKDLTEIKFDDTEIVCVLPEISYVTTKIIRGRAEIDFVWEEIYGAFPENTSSF
jgi:hypothetical protein